MIIIKRICFLEGDMSRSGGTERVTSIIANELSKKENFEIHIISIENQKNRSFFKLEDEVKHSTILDTRNKSKLNKYIQIIKGIRTYIKENSIDILVDVDVICNIFSIPATRGTKTKLLSWEHFNICNNNGSKIRDLSRKLSTRFSDYIITLTEKDKNNYINKLNIKSNIDYIYNPVIKRNEEECNIESRQIISVGRLTNVKGFDMLCDVAEVVLPKNTEWKWIILGEGEDRPLLEEKIKKYNLEDRLILKGNVSNIDEYYKNSSIFVMTSRYEGLPMTLLEAKSYSLPIVSFDCMTGPSDIISDNINGYLINENNLEEMSKKINILINDIDTRLRFKQNAKYDIDKFDLDKIINKWINVLSNL